MKVELPRTKVVSLYSPLNNDELTSSPALIIDCDEIRSRVRSPFFEPFNPASSSFFCREVAFRGLVQMDKAVATLGLEKARNQCMHIGSRAHVLNFLIAQQTLMNIVAFADQEE